MQETNVQRDTQQESEGIQVPTPQSANGQISEFERILIQECREEGMPDEEIMAWMKEI